MAATEPLTVTLQMTKTDLKLLDHILEMYIRQRTYNRQVLRKKFQIKNPRATEVRVPKYIIMPD